MGQWGTAVQCSIREGIKSMAMEHKIHIFPQPLPFQQALKLLQLKTWVEESRTG